MIGIEIGIEKEIEMTDTKVEEMMIIGMTGEVLSNKIKQRHYKL